MRKTAITGFLFSIIGLAAMPMLAKAAANKDDLILLEELPTEVRADVYGRVVDFLNQNPQMIDAASTIAIDSKGTVYVLDKNLAIVSRVGEPSCMAAASVGQPSCMGRSASIGSPCVQRTEEKSGNQE